MNSYKHLDVFTEGIKVGTLALTPERTVAFAYDDEWLANGFSLNPLSKLFRLMCFNVFSHNRDDHSKNFSFLYDHLSGKWSLSPAYDLTYSNSIGGEHATTVNGNGQNPGIKDIMAVADHIKLNHSTAYDIAVGIQNIVENNLHDLIEK